MNKASLLKNNQKEKVQDFIRMNNSNIELQDSDKNIIILNERDNVCGLIQLTYEGWDSKLLKVKTAKIKNIVIDKKDRSEIIKSAISFIKENKIATYISYQPEATDFSMVKSLIENGFEIMGLPVILSLDAESVNRDFEINNNIREYKKQDLIYLQEIAKTAFKYSHLYHNPYLKEENVNNLYSEWITNCCRERANIVFVVEEGNKTNGFIACVIKNLDNRKEGWIDLIAISRDTRTKGLGSDLVKAAVNWFRTRVDEIKVKTEAMNYASLRIYQKAGFKVNWTGLNLNLWLR